MTRIRTAIRLSFAAFAAALLLGACGGSFDRDEFIADLQEGPNGLTQAQAECVTDGMIDEFGEDRLNDRGNPTDEEQDRMIDLTTDCLLAG